MPFVAPGFLVLAALGMLGTAKAVAATISSVHTRAALRIAIRDGRGRARLFERGYDPSPEPLQILSIPLFKTRF